MNLNKLIKTDIMPLLGLLHIVPVAFIIMTLFSSGGDVLYNIKLSYLSGMLINIPLGFIIALMYLYVWINKE